MTYSRLELTGQEFLYHRPLAGSSQAGWFGCWWYRRSAPGETVFEGLEMDAREARKGLWVDPRPVPTVGFM